MKMKIAIAGTRGVPNRYGGFEQLAQHLSLALVKKGHEVTVYNSSTHPFRGAVWNGVKIVRRSDPQRWLGTAAQFLYDLRCILHARRQEYDVLLMLGYTSSSIWGRWFPKRCSVITNMDGMEWKRSKYNRLTRIFLRWAERNAVRYSTTLVADSKAIEAYLKKKYGADQEYIPYGAETGICEDAGILFQLSLEAGKYFLLIARMEKENNIEMILDGFTSTQSSYPFIVVGPTRNRFGRRMHQKYKNDQRIRFVQGIYNTEKLHTLRRYCTLYFHGHSVGGTNPSLLEAMASGSLIAAHRNVFNEAVLGNDAFYFDSASEVAALVQPQVRNLFWTHANLLKIHRQYNWPLITEQYEQLCKRCSSCTQTVISGSKDDGKQDHLLPPAGVRDRVAVREAVQ